MRNPTDQYNYLRQGMLKKKNDMPGNVDEVIPFMVRSGVGRCSEEERRDGRRQGEKNYLKTRKKINH